MTHYLVYSPTMSKVVPILDDGTGPLEDFANTCFVDAQNKREAYIKAVKLPEMKEWVREQRDNGKPPFAGLKAQVSMCPHGNCWCDECRQKNGDCKECDKELEARMEAE